MIKTKPSRRKYRSFHEPLEHRQLLAANPIITEFTASNNDLLTDGYGENSDWIEIFNAGDLALDIGGWYLTDDASDLTKWTFPTANLAAGEYLVVFASGRGSVDPTGKLHTNFRLRSQGEQLALVRPDGATVVSSFGDFDINYPTQFADVSYGVAFADLPLITRNSPVDVIVPDVSIDDRYGQTWIDGDPASFEVAGGLDGWTRGSAGAGYTLDTVGAYRDAVTSEPSLFSYYTFDNDNIDAKGIHDTVGARPADGSVVGSVKFGEGVGGRALSLDGKGHVDLGAVAELQFLDRTGTIEAWIRPTHLPRGTDPAWFGTRMERTSPKRDRYSLRVDGIYNGLHTTSTASGVTSTDREVTPGEWIHVAVVFNVENRDPTTTYFVNGRQIGDTQLGGIQQTGGIIFSFIGSSAFPGSNSNFVGDIDELAMYTDPLDASTIQEHFAAFSFPVDNNFVNLQSQMLDKSASAYLRYPFSVNDPDALRSLTLKMRYDDGFVAYVNGVRVVSQGAPDELNHQSAATTQQTVTFPGSFNISSGLGTLRTGKNVLAVHGLNSDKSDPDFFAFAELMANSLMQDQNLFYLNPTPGAPNADGVSGITLSPTTDVQRGFFSEPFDVTATSNTPGATLVYTLDGSTPSEFNGTRVAAAGPDVAPQVTLPVSRTTTLRVSAFHADLEPSRKVTTQTYIFTTDIIRQRTMDGQVIGPGDRYRGKYAATIQDDLLALPSISLITNRADIFGSRGVYNNNTRGRQSERPISVEYFDPSSQAQFQIDGGVRLHGADSRGHAKKALRLYFRDDYGEPRLNFPLFEDSAVDSFKRLILRPGAHDSFTTPHQNRQTGFWQAERGLLVRDNYARETHLALGGLSPHGRHIHLYINGDYWGMYEIVERPDEFFFAAHLGGDPAEWDVLTTETKNNPPPVVKNGNLDAWNAMMAIVNAGVTGDESYARLQQYLDVDAFIDYFIVSQWLGEADWLSGDLSTNWFTSRHPGEGKFRFHFWDYEQNLGHDGSSTSMKINVNFTSNLNSSNSPARIYNQLRKNTEFRLRFADRVQELLFNDGLLTPEHTLPRWHNLLNEVDEAIVAESARWGDQVLNTPRTRDETWAVEANWITENFFTRRNPVVATQYRRIGLYPDMGAPQLLINGVLQHGGDVKAKDRLSVRTPRSETIYVTTGGSDPRSPGGAVSPQAITLESGASIPITTDMVVNVRLRDGDEWSALVTAQFTIPLETVETGLRISEIHYNPTEPTADEIAVGYDNNDDFEFVELVNISGQSVDLRQFRFPRQDVEGDAQGINFDFASATIQTLAPGERLVLVEDLPAFRFRYGDHVPVAGQWAGGLGNDREQITLVLADQIIQQFAYDEIWHTQTDGEGFSLEINDATAEDMELWSRSEGWLASTQVGGTPGRPFAPGNFDGNAQIDSRDIDLLLDAIHSAKNHWTFDLTGDGLVENADLEQLVEGILGTRFGDLDLDGNVDTDDFTTFAANFGALSATWAAGDLDGDGEVAFNDFIRLSNEFGFEDQR